MGTRFGIVNVSLSFDIDLDDLAKALEYENETMEKMIEVAKANYVDTLMDMPDSAKFDWLDVTTVIEGE
jgi:hypothetical protein